MELDDFLEDIRLSFAPFDESLEKGLPGVVDLVVTEDPDIHPDRRALSSPVADAVAWSAEMRVTEGFLGLYLRQDQTIALRGVSIGRDIGNGPEFSRFIDWNDVMGQLGLTASWMPIQPDQDLR
jgi:hypothetical protein